MPPRDPEQAVNGTAGHLPGRRARSARRTSSIDMTWPDGVSGPLLMDGRARDIVTIEPGDDPAVVDDGWMRATVGGFRTIRALETNIDHPGIAALIGCRGGGHLRAALDQHLPDERAAGTPLALLLDDISGASLISHFVWMRWTPGSSRAGSTPVEPPAASRGPLEPADTGVHPMEGICIGFAPGNSSLEEMALGTVARRIQEVPPLADPADPCGFHALPVPAEISMRRARWIDVWRESGPTGQVIRVASGFQDSTTDPDPDVERSAVHEYLLSAAIDPASMALTGIEADPRVLPFRECPRAAETARRLVGTHVADLRRTVLDRLAKTDGCTHLNDALRALAEVPVLLAHLDAAAR